MNVNTLWNDAVQATRAHADQLRASQRMAAQIDIPREIMARHAEIMECEAEGLTHLAEALRRILSKQAQLWECFDCEEPKLTENALNPVRK